jgi:hypothetical protein
MQSRAVVSSSSSSSSSSGGGGSSSTVDVELVSMPIVCESRLSQGAQCTGNHSVSSLQRPFSTIVVGRNESNPGLSSVALASVSFFQCVLRSVDPATPGRLGYIVANQECQMLANNFQSSSASSAALSAAPSAAAVASTSVSNSCHSEGRCAESVL